MGEGEREGEKHQCVVDFRTLSTGNLARNPVMCPDGELNQGPYGLQAGTWSTGPHQPGQDFMTFICKKISPSYLLYQD